MSYAPAIIATSDYPDVRLALGLDATDTTTLADAVIEGRPYLQWVERVVKQRFTTYATILSDAGDKAEALKDGVVLATAAMVARGYLAARTSEEVQRTTVGPYTTQYRPGPEWTALADDLAERAAEVLSRVSRWSQSPQAITMHGRSGPTRKAQTDENMMTASKWAEYLTPPVIRGRQWYDPDVLDTI